MNRLENKVALITGASSGIGHATAELFAKEGAVIVAAARRKDRLDELIEKITENGGKALAIQADLVKKTDCEKVVNQAIEEFGQIDILVNNAGMLDRHMSAVNMTDELWSDVVAINQTSVFMMCRETLKHMSLQESGSVINISSVAGVDATSGFAYSATKFAVVGMTKNIAIQYAGTGIRCNAVCPGPTPTELNTPEKINTFDLEFGEITRRHNDFTVGRSDVTDQANAILFFC